MCDIKEIYPQDSVTVYKVVLKKSDGSYESPFAQCPVNIGKVKQMRPNGFVMYNNLMEGRCSGFANVEDAKLLCNAFRNTKCLKKWNEKPIIIEMVLHKTVSDHILQGTGKLMMNGLDDAIVLAGPVVKSIKELEL